MNGMRLQGEWGDVPAGYRPPYHYPQPANALLRREASAYTPTFEVLLHVQCLTCLTEALLTEMWWTSSSSSSAQSGRNHVSSH